MLQHNKEKRRFEWTEKETTSFIAYHIKDSKFILHHSEVPPAHRGKGIGKKMVESTYEYLESNEIAAHATCSFIRLVGSRNPRWKQFI